MCVLCNGEPEFVSHIFMYCKFTKNIYEDFVLDILKLIRIHFVINMILAYYLILTILYIVI